MCWAARRRCGAGGPGGERVSGCEGPVCLCPPDPYSPSPAAQHTLFMTLERRNPRGWFLSQSRAARPPVITIQLWSGFAYAYTANASPDRHREV